MPLSETVSLEENSLDISTVTEAKELNQLFEVLASHELIAGISVKENHLKDVFMKG